jgi:hypothetical protein
MPTQKGASQAGSGPNTGTPKAGQAIDGAMWPEVGRATRRAEILPLVGETPFGGIDMHLRGMDRRSMGQRTSVWRRKVQA